MYKKLMVPLDGSELAECVLPHVEAIATGCNVNAVVFVRAVEPVYLPVNIGVFIGENVEQAQEEMDARNKSEAEAYLDQLAGRVKLEGVKVQTQVIVGNADESLVDYAASNDVDLIVIATHGRSGVSRWVRGSVADRILHSASAPVLMVRAPGM
jgi:nucleotide-binding universal stress UspA family protein